MAQVPYGYAHVVMAVAYGTVLVIDTIERLLCTC